MFTPLEVRPLHTGLPDDDDGWWACSQPERPADSRTRWDLRCRACAIHSWASIKVGLTTDPVPVATGAAGDLKPSDLTHIEAVQRALIDIHDLDPELLR